MKQTKCNTDAFVTELNLQQQQKCGKGQRGLLQMQQVRP